MKLEIRVGIDFGKLANEMPKIIDKTLEDAVEGSVEATRKKIDSGSLKALKDSTVDIRSHRGQAGDKPLYASGTLYKSLKRKKDSLSMAYYGKYQEEGFKPKRIPIIREKDNKIVYPLNKGNIRVPARPFIEIGEASTENMIKSMRKALNLKSPLVLKV